MLSKYEIENYRRIIENNKTFAVKLDIHAL